MVVNCLRKIFHSLEESVSDYITNEHEEGLRRTVICLYKDRVNNLNLHDKTEQNMREWLIIYTITYKSIKQSNLKA